MGRVTVQTVPCTSLHGIGADEVMVSGYLVFAPLRSVLNMRHWRIAPLSVGDFRWADAVTVHARRVCTVTGAAKYLLNWKNYLHLKIKRCIIFFVMQI